MRPGVTVVIPTRNRVSLLRQTLASALGQTGVDHEVVVVDDGSTDGTADYLSAVTDPRLRILTSSAGRGVSEARNAGLAAARYEWVAFLDDDDLWAPDKLAAQVRVAGEGVEWVTVGAVDVDDRLQVTGGARPPLAQKDTPRLLHANNIPGGGSGTMVRTQLVRRLGGFDPALQTLADWDLWLRVSPLCDMASVQRPLVAYRVHAGSMSHTDDRFREELAAVGRKHAASAEAFGVTLDEVGYLLWYADNLLRAGASRQVRATWRALVRRRRTPRILAVAALAHLAPRLLLELKDRRRLRRTPPGYRQEADRWLAPYRPPAGPVRESP